MLPARGREGAQPRVLSTVCGNMLPTKHALQAAEASATADLHVLADCGHWPHMERAAEFNALALEFLSG